MLGQSRQTGALHVNAGETDGIIFFEAGEILHAECGTYFGDEAVTEIVKTCHATEKGVYKFVYGATATQRTVSVSYTHLKHRDRAMKEGASGFLTKPVQEDQLISTVEGLIDPVKPKGRPALRVPVMQDGND